MLFKSTKIDSKVGAPAADFLPTGDKGVVGITGSVDDGGDDAIVDVRKFVDLNFAVGEDDVDELLPHNDKDVVMEPNVEQEDDSVEDSDVLVVGFVAFSICK